MVGLIASLLFCFILFLAIVIVNILVHREMTLRHSYHYGYGNFKLFMKEFNSKDWDIDSNYNTVFEDFKTGSRVGNDIIRFNEMGMLILNPIEYLKVKWYLRKVHKTFLIARKRTWE